MAMQLKKIYSVLGELTDGNETRRCAIKGIAPIPSLSRNHCFDDLKLKMVDYTRNGGKFVTQKTGQMLPTAVEFRLQNTYSVR